jgi:hypothetical protein
VASNCSFQRKGRVSRRRRSLLALELRGVRLVCIRVGSKHANNINEHQQRAQEQPAVYDAPKSASGGLQLHTAKKGTRISW